MRFPKSNLSTIIRIKLHITYAYFKNIKYNQANTKTMDISIVFM